MKTNGCNSCSFFDTQKKTDTFWCVRKPSQIDEEPFCQAASEYVKDLDKCPENWVREKMRRDCLMSVEIMCQGKTSKASIMDMSDRGVFLKTSSSLMPGSDITLTFSLPHRYRSARTFKITGIVVRSTPEGTGVKFKNTRQCWNLLMKRILELTEER